MRALKMKRPLGGIPTGPDKSGNRTLFRVQDFTQFIFLFAILSMVGLAALVGAVMLGMQIVDDRQLA